jgi:hypothetical protein
MITQIKKILLIILVCFLTLSLTGKPEANSDKMLCGHDTSILRGDEGWKLIKDNHGIRVYKRNIPILDGHMWSFRGVAVLDAEFSRLVALVWDTEDYKEWVWGADEVKCVKKVSETEEYYYFLTKLTFPLKSRDRVDHRTIYQDTKTLAVVMEGCSDSGYIPKKKGIIRMPFVAVYAKITPLGNGKVELIYEAVADVGGWVPDWAVNLFTANISYWTFRRIQELLPLEKFKDVKFTWLKLPGEENMPVTTLIVEENDKK